MIKLESHLHTKGGSVCATETNELILERYVKEGYQGLVVTNHYNEPSYYNYPGNTHKEKMDFYFSLVDSMICEAEKYNLRIFWGTEVNAFRQDGFSSEYMIYGITRKFIYDNKPLFTMTQQELFKLCDKNNFFMYQTHPFRKGITVGDPEFLHGAEGFNGHYHHENNNDKAKEFIIKNNLRMMSGTDFHHADQPINAGIYIPDNICTNEQLSDYIFNCQPKLIEEE